MHRAAGRIWRLALLVSLVGTASVAGAATRTDRARALLAERYGLELVDGDGAEAWLPAEAAVLLRLVATLPQPLQALAPSSRFGRIKLFKSYAPPSRGASHTAPAVLFWQVQVNLHSDPGDPADDRSCGDAFAVDETFLQRRFVRAWMYAYDASTQASSAPAWRALSGWRERQYLGIALPFVPREADNQDPRGYAAADGMQDAGSDLATFAELYFVPAPTPVEASIRCRLPEKYGYFHRLFPAYRPALDAAENRCKSTGDGFLDDVRFFDPVTREEIAMGPVDDDSVTGFELLYATPGVGDAAEVAGHLILRVQLANNPQATRLGVENPHDLVLAFLADTEAGRPPAPALPGAAAPLPAACPHGWLGFAAPAPGESAEPLRAVLQALSGLSGGFYSLFDRQTLEQVVKTYTVDQDRSLLRYRLNLTAPQRQALLARLYAAKKNYRTKYYFFDRNCASILVRLIGEGLGDTELAGFDPLVVPPNALVALLIRKGLVAQVHPSFYSYRKRGHVAQEELRTRLAALAEAYPQVAWPSARALVSADEERRMAGYTALAHVAAARPALADELYRLALFGQEAELAFADHAQRCEAYTSRPTAALRSLQQRLAAATAAGSPAKGVDFNRVVYERYAATEALDSITGSSHTGLAAVGLAAGRYAVAAGAHAEPVAVVDLALHRQEMGEMATQAMQRATAVTLGAVSAAVSRDGDGRPQLAEGRFTGLSLRKLKERLDDVPSYADGAGALGLGLTVLDARYSSQDQALRATVAGGELLVNLLSSRLYNRFLYVSVGAAVETDWLRTGSGQGGFDKRETGLKLPVRVEALWTFDAQRLWQLRGEAEVRDGVLAGKVTRGLLGEVRLIHRLWEPGGTEVLLRLGASVQRLALPDGVAGDQTSLFQAGLEWNRW